MTTQRQRKILVYSLPDAPPINVDFPNVVAEEIACDEPPRLSELLLKPELDAVIVNTAQSSAVSAIRFANDLRPCMPSLPLILAISESSEELAIQAVNAGVSWYLKHPISAAQLYKALTNVLERCVSKPVKAHKSSEPSTERLLGCSKAICELREYIDRISRCQSNVLITGETGTGKELVAELVHLKSPRRSSPFVCLNTAAIPDTLLESELFGHERGAFTGAGWAHRGKLALAHKGTLFFDEIGEVSMPAQAKLLRAIEGKSVYRVGGEKEFAFDVRILAATNQDLDAAMQQDHFRKDLYYRLNVVRIQVPPLRDRREDIPLLLSHYINHFSSSFGLHVEGFTEEALHQLMSYEWPGNIRELRNVVEAIFVNLKEPMVDISGLPPCITKYLATPSKPAERDELLRALATTKWNMTKAADRMHWSRTTLYRKMATYKIVRIDQTSQGKKVPQLAAF
ncbi:MAG TPA: sigma-54 dependent transcriptional regulator [Methylocystis sp.]|jgi:DNA-binding NtrC family response regulator